MKSKITLAAVFAAVTLVLSGCTPASDGNSRMLDIYVSPDETVYADVEVITGMKDTVIIDDEDDMRAFLYGSSSCPPTIERILTDEVNLYLYLEDYGDRACTEDYGSTPQKVTSVSFGNFEDIKEVFLCTTAEDCKPVENVIFSRLV